MLGGHRFTIYDMMEAKGVFQQNPANASSPYYTGPQQFPMMLYHPKGERRVSVPQETLRDSQGNFIKDEDGRIIKRGGETEIIWKIVQNDEELDSALLEGWHRHPADAMRAAGEDAPMAGGQKSLSEMEGEIQRLQKEIERAKMQQKGVKAAPAAPLKVDLA